MIEPNIIARLQAEVPALKLVEGAAEFMTAVESNPVVTPASFVIPLQDDAMPSADVDVVIQRCVARYGVIYVTRNLKDPKGAAALQDIQALRLSGKEKLLGWMPAAGFAPLERAAGHLLAFRNGHMWWQDIYLTSYYDRSTL